MRKDKGLNGDLDRVMFLKFLDDFEIQREYEAQFSGNALHGEVDALKRLQAETATELDALLPAILDRAFKGEL